MNFILNIIMAAVSLTTLAVFALIILAVALVIRVAGYVATKELEEQHFRQEDEMRIAAVKIIKIIRSANNEDHCWAAGRMINQFVANFCDHPDINKEEAELRDLLKDKVAEVFVPAFTI